MSSNHGGLKAFGERLIMNSRGFIHQIWDNKVYPPFFDREAISRMKATWETDEHDILICTHQKVGTHLTKKFTVEILRNGIQYPPEFGIAKGDIGHGTIPWPEVMVSQHGIDHFNQFLENTEGYPRLWYLHCHWEDLPFKKLHPKTKFIFVFRDPRGAFESQYHFYKSHPMLGVDPDLTQEEFLDMFLDGNMYFGDFHRHTLEWISGCNGQIAPENLLILRYEDLVEQKMESARRIARFVLPEDNLSQKRMQEIISATEFSKMKQEMTHNPQSFHFNPNTFFRQGKSYGWMEKLPKEIISKIDEKSRKIWGEQNLASPVLPHLKN
jgi:hypothetical protein